MQPTQPSDDRNLSVPSRDDATVRAPDRDAAAAVMREQIDRIYNQDEKPTPQTYARTHSEDVEHRAASHDEHMSRYHSAWQQYYQQYYERYYLSQLKNRSHTPSEKRTSPAHTAQPVMVTAGVPDEPELTKDQAVHELRDELLGKVKQHSETVRKSRHFMPILSAIVVALVFLLLQYNRVMIAQVKAYVSPGTIDPQNIVIDPSTDTKVGPEPKLVIPKINVEAPVVYGVGSLADPPVQKALKDGVVHYPIPGADSVPGQTGNTVILGHSSNDVFDDGAYKFIFVQLEKLQPGDTFYINYLGTRYTYSIKEKKVILPTEVSTLILDTDKPMATLVTCVPIGTALKRLVVIAEQVSPDPTKATQHTATTPSGRAEALPGNSPGFLQRLFGD